MSKQSFHPTQIGPNHFTYQNAIDIQVTCRGRIFDVPAGHTMFFEDAGEFPTTVVTTAEVEGTFYRFIIEDRIERSGDAGQVVIDRGEELARARKAALAEIDRSAEEVRGYFITLGAGQSMVYQQKRVEAEKVIANAAIDPADVPHIAGEATLNGIGNLEQAQIIMAMSEAWTDTSALIEQRRLAAKKAVSAATTLDAIEDAQLVDWSDIIALAQG